MPIDEPTDKSGKPVNRPETDEVSLEWFADPTRAPDVVGSVQAGDAGQGTAQSNSAPQVQVPPAAQRSSYVAPDPAAVVPGPLVQAPPAVVGAPPAQQTTPDSSVEAPAYEAAPVRLPPATFEPFIAPQETVAPQYIQPAPSQQPVDSPVTEAPYQPAVPPETQPDYVNAPMPADQVYAPQTPIAPQAIDPIVQHQNPVRNSPEQITPAHLAEPQLHQLPPDPQIDAQLEIERGVGLRPTAAPLQQTPQSAQPSDPGYISPPVRNDLLRGDAYEVPSANTTVNVGTEPSRLEAIPAAGGSGSVSGMPPPGSKWPKFKLPKPKFATSQNPWVRQLALIGGGIVGLIVLLVFVLPFFLPSQTIANEVSRQVKLATGWVLRIDGPISVGVFPTPRFSASDVSISADGENSVLRTDSIRFGINLAAIFTGNVRLDEVALVSPSIDLVVDESGRATWEQASSSPLDADLRPSTGAAGEAVVDDAGSALEALERLQIDEVTIRNGTVRYQDLRTTTEHVISDIDITTALTSLDVPLIIDSSFAYKDQSFELKTQLDDPGAAVDGARSAIDIALDGNVVDASLGGTVDFGLGPAFGGQFTSNIPSVTGLAAWLGTELPENSEGLESIQASAELAASPTAVDISNFALRVGEETVQGALRADLTQTDPFLSGQLVSQGVDVATLLSAAGLTGEGQPSLDGSLIVDLQFATVGMDVEQMLSSLNARGTLGLRSGTVSQTGIGLALGEADADTIKNITANITINTLDTPIGLVGQANWRNERFEMSGQFGAGQMLVNGMGPAQLAINSNRVSGGINGTLTQTGDFNGDVTLETRSLRGLMAWLNQPIGNGGGLGPFSYTGQLSLGPSAVNFENARILLDGTSGTGNGTITLSGKPKLNATLNLQQLDLTPYISGEGSTSSAVPAGGSNSNLPGVSGSSVNGGWSTEVIDLSGLRSIDANLNISAQEIIWDGIRTGRTAMAVALTDGILTADLTEMQLYEGRGAGRLEVNASGETPEIGVNFDLSSLSAYPFLRDAAQFTRLEGAADFSIALKTSGRSELGLVSGLDGETRMVFSNGAIRGINIPKMVRTLSARTLLGWQSNEQEKTDFSEFGGSFQFTNGLARTRDIRLVGPLVRATGAGSIDLPAKTLEMRFDPRVVASLQGQGGGQDLAGLGVPIVVEGSFAQPRIYPDIAGILENPDAAFQQLQRFGGGLAALTDNGDALRDQVRERTGVDLNQVVRDGRIDRDTAIGQGANLIGRLIGNQGQGGGLAPVGGNTGVAAPQVNAGGIPVPRSDPRGSFVRPTGPANAAPRFMTPAEARRATGGRAVVSGNGGNTTRAPAAAPAAPARSNNSGPIDLLSPGASQGSGIRTTVQPGTGNPQGPASNPVEGLLRGIFGR
ncbi:MAG: AsmA family protein [Hyphomicrobiales bacterium]